LVTGQIQHLNKYRTEVNSTAAAIAIINMSAVVNHLSTICTKQQTREREKPILQQYNYLKKFSSIYS
jgi:hypothetical protein